MTVLARRHCSERHRQQTTLQQLFYRWQWVWDDYLKRTMLAISHQMKYVIVYLHCVVLEILSSILDLWQELELWCGSGSGDWGIDISPRWALKPVEGSTKKHDQRPQLIVSLYIFTLNNTVFTSSTGLHCVVTKSFTFTFTYKNRRIIVCNVDSKYIQSRLHTMLSNIIIGLGLSALSSYI